MSAADAQTESPSSPTLIGPSDATVANGKRVTFAWEPLAQAERYRLQVASTASFDDVIVDEDVGNETAVTVGNQFPTDGDTYFWRVLAGTEAGWGAPSEVESFIAGDKEEADQALVEREDVGAVTGLARAEKREATQKVVDFEDRFEQEKERGVAYEGIAATQIIAIAVSILVVIMVAVVVLFGWYGQVAQETRAAASDVQNYELRQQAETEATEALTQYGVVDGEEGVYRIPIDRAMDLVAQEEYERTQPPEAATNGSGGQSQ